MMSRCLLLAAVATSGSSVFKVSHTSPRHVGPMGGAVLLLHGEGLPYRDALIGDALITVGGEACPLLPRRSDPRGTFLACVIPPTRSSGNATLQPQQSRVLLRTHGAFFGCPECTVSYAHALQAAATLRLSHRLGAEGDAIHLQSNGPWPLLDESYGHHEQVSNKGGPQRPPCPLPCRRPLANYDSCLPNSCPPPAGERHHRGPRGGAALPILDGGAPHRRRR